MTDYLREVEESMRAEKFARLWQDHGRFFIMACVALVVGTAAQSAWKSYTLSQNEKATASFLDALKNEDPIPSLQDIGADGKGSEAALANLYAGNILTTKKEWTKAISSYQLVIADRHAPKTYRDLALVQMVALQIDHDASAKPETLLAALSPLTAAKSSIWSARAILLSAIIKADKQQNYTDAVTTLKPLLADTTLPTGFAAQIAALNQVYTLKGSSK